MLSILWWCGEGGVGVKNICKYLWGEMWQKKTLLFVGGGGGGEKHIFLVLFFSFLFLRGGVGVKKKENKIPPLLSIGVGAVERGVAV